MCKTNAKKSYIEISSNMILSTFRHLDLVSACMYVVFAVTLTSEIMKIH